MRVLKGLLKTCSGRSAPDKTFVETLVQGATKELCHMGWAELPYPGKKVRDNIIMLLLLFCNKYLMGIRFNLINNGYNWDTFIIVAYHFSYSMHYLN